MMKPDYKLLYYDIIHKKYPDKKEQCKTILEKENLSFADIIELNKKIFDTNEEMESANQKHRSYSQKDIFHILDYQRKNKLNNRQLAKHFKLSRNTIAKWKKIFISTTRCAMN